MRPLVGIDAFALENQPSRQHGFDAPSVLDARYRGASAWTEFDSDEQSHEIDVRGALSYGTVNPLRMPAMHRATAQLAVRWRTAADARRLAIRGASCALNSTSGVHGRRAMGSRASSRAQSRPTGWGTRSS